MAISFSTASPYSAIPPEVTEAMHARMNALGIRREDNERVFDDIYRNAAEGLIMAFHFPEPSRSRYLEAKRAAELSERLLEPDAVTATIAMNARTDNAIQSGAAFYEEETFNYVDITGSTQTVTYTDLFNNLTRAIAKAGVEVYRPNQAHGGTPLNQQP